MKKIIIGLFAILVVIQFFRPARNLSGDMKYDITTRYEMTADVSEVFRTACFDCHSNTTRYPWYANIQPLAWWINDHITEGKRHMNYSAFAALPVANQVRKLEETIEQVESGEMPLRSYTALGMHKDANLSDARRKVIIDWARNQIENLRAIYPADSLVLRRRQRAQPAD